MDKEKYLINLYEDIEKEIEFDSDIEALVKILEVLYHINGKESFELWRQLIEKHNIKELENDIDLLPLLVTYPMKIIKEKGLEHFFNQMNIISVANQKIIYKELFNIYHENSLLYSYMLHLIIEKKEQEELRTIESIIKHNHLFSISTFDLFHFLRKIILIHIEQNKISIPLFEKLIDHIHNKKEQAILKTLYIDYI